MKNKLKNLFHSHNWEYSGFKNWKRKCVKCGVSEEAYMCGASDTLRWREPFREQDNKKEV